MLENDFGQLWQPPSGGLDLVEEAPQEGTQEGTQEEEEADHLDHPDNPDKVR